MSTPRKFRAPGLYKGFLRKRTFHLTPRGTNRPQQLRDRDDEPVRGKPADWELGIHAECVAKAVDMSEASTKENRVYLRSGLASDIKMLANEGLPSRLIHARLRQIGYKALTLGLVKKYLRRMPV